MDVASQQRLLAFFAREAAAKEARDRFLSAKHNKRRGGELKPPGPWKPGSKPAAAEPPPGQKRLREEPEEGEPEKAGKKGGGSKGKGKGKGKGKRRVARPLADKRRPAEAEAAPDPEARGHRFIPKPNAANILQDYVDI